MNLVISQDSNNPSDLCGHIENFLSDKEIADFYGCDESLIRHSYSEYLTKGKAEMKLRLRQLQWKSAEKGNVVMQIWLGKQMLGQTEYPITEDTEPLKWSAD